MKIDYLQVSNILSFPYVDQIDEAEKITFDSGLNIVIGENGSGKSTILEIINFIFKRVIYRQYNVNQELFERRSSLSADERRQVLQPANSQNLSGFRLDANWDSEGQAQTIRIAISLDEIDTQNISNIRKHLAFIEKSISLYSTQSLSDEGIAREDYVIDIVLQKDNNTFSTQFVGGSSDFGFIYLTEYHFIKEAISFHNFLNRSNQLPPLYESFTLISSYRNYHAFKPAVSLGGAPAAQQIQQIRAQDYNRSLNAADQSEPPIFALVRLEVARRHFDLIPERKSQTQCEAEANKLPFVLAINRRLRV